MKQRILFTFVILLGMAAAASTTAILTTSPLAIAEEGIAIDESNFPDANFRQYVLDSIDSNSDSFLSTAEAEAVEKIDVSEKAISDLTGIGFFSKLKELFCYNSFDETDASNHLTALDLSQNTELVRLACGQNEITSLDLSHNVNLENLHCGNNQLSTIDVSHQPKLWRLYCNGNQLTTIDVSHNPELTELRCFENQIASLDLKTCTKLEILYCYSNNLTSLDLTGCTQLVELWCHNNNLTSLDVTSCPKLEKLYCYSNNLTSLDVTSCPKLEILSCFNNNLASLNVTGCTQLVELWCYNNNLSSLDVTSCSKLEEFSCYSNNLASLDVTSCPELVRLWCYNNNLTSLDLTRNTALKELNCGYNYLTSLDVANCPQLEELYCYYNELTTLDVSHNPELYYLYCLENRIAGKGMDALIASLVKYDSGSNYLILYNYDSETEQNVCTKSQVNAINNKGWIAGCYYQGELYYYEGTDEVVPSGVTVVSDLEEYTGNDPYVYNQADGKLYVLNNLNEYEEYGVYEKTATLKVAEGDTEIEYIETKTNGNHPYINTGYIFKENTRIVVECDLTKNTVKNYEAVFGARHGISEDAFVFFSRFNSNNAGCWVRNQEVRGSTVLPMGQRIIIDAEGKTANIYKADSSEPYSTITCTADISSGREEMYIFDLNNGGSRDNSWAFMKLYSFKIYEGQELVMDLKPIVSATGKGGLVDKISGQRFFSADPELSFSLSPDGEAVVNDLGITVYEGKLVVNTTDGYLYKYTNGSFTQVGKVTLTPIAGTDYKDLRNWQTNDDHKSVFEGKIIYDEQNDLNKIDNFAGIGFFEPLMIRIPTTSGDDYNFSFVYSGSPYTSWHGVEMHAYVTNAYNLSTEESALACGGDILATYTLPFGGATDMKVSMDFTAARDQETLVYQFGDVEDGEKGYWFHFGQLLVQKYNYPVAYPDLLAEDEGLKGDVNGDGTVGIGDIVAITNVMAGIETDEAVKARADVNDDGSVGIGDIVAITNIMAGIE